MALMISLLVAASVFFGMAYLSEREFRKYYQGEMIRYREMWDRQTWNKPKEPDHES